MFWALFIDMTGNTDSVPKDVTKGRSNGNVLDDVTCPGLLISNWLPTETPLPETIILLGKNRKIEKYNTTNAVYCTVI